LDDNDILKISGFEFSSLITPQNDSKNKFFPTRDGVPKYTAPEVLKGNGIKIFNKKN
jgi:serine/threonine protein kinase